MGKGYVDGPKHELLHWSREESCYNVPLRNQCREFTVSRDVAPSGNIKETASRIRLGIERMILAQGNRSGIPRVTPTPRHGLSLIWITEIKLEGSEDERIVGEFMAPCKTRTGCESDY
eukprot:scaffold6216_cov149-Amphora_coffeaeformis.AAC.3